MINVDPSVNVRLKKLIATSVAFAFVFNNIVFAHVPQTSVWAERNPSSRQVFGRDLSQAAAFQINRDPGQMHAGMTAPALPTQYGIVHESNRIAGQTPLLLIQDIHLNFEAQSNVARMLMQLQQNGRLGNVGVEGAFEHFDFKPFFDAGDRQTRQTVADAFLKDNRIGAPSYAGVTSAELPANFFGIDDLPLYRANVASYRAGFKQQKNLLATLDLRRRALTGKKNALFNRQLLALDAAVESYQSGKTGLAELLEKIPPTTPALAQFLEAALLEKKINFPMAERQKREIVSQLVPKLSTSEMEQLTQIGAAHNAGDVSTAEFYRLLNSLLKHHGISTAQSPAFENYLHYTTLADAISGADLVGDIQPAIWNALQASAKTDGERELIAQARSLQLETKLVQFALTPAEWDEYQHRGIHTNLAAFENFYRFADQRSGKIVDNFLGLKQAKGTSALIIGGFHTPGVTAELKKRGIAYVVMSPKITTADVDGSAYLSVFSREKTPLEKLFAGELLFINPDEIGLGTSVAFDSNSDFVVAETALVTRNGILLHEGKKYAVNRSVPWFHFAVGKPAVIGGQTVQPIISLFSIPRAIVRALLSKIKIFLWASLFLLLDASDLLAGNGDVKASVRSIVPLVLLGIPLLLTAGLSGIGSRGFAGITGSDTWVSKNAARLKGKTIVEVTMELALSKPMFDEFKAQGLDDETLRALAMSNSTGGIGPLLKERVIAQSELGADVIAFTPLYNEVFVQKVVPVGDGSPKTKIVQEKVQVGQHWKHVFDLVGTIPVKLPNDTVIDVEVHLAKPGMYGQARVFGFSFPQYTSVVYPGEHDSPGYSEQMRLLQSWITGRGALQVLMELAAKSELGDPAKKENPDVAVVMSEMPSIFGDHRLFQDDFTNNPFFKNFRYVFNDHTPLDYAHPHWDWPNLTRMKMVNKFFEKLSVWFKKGSSWLVDGTAVAINASHASFGVAKKHGVVMRDMESLAQFGPKIQTVTNGVSDSYWPDAELANYENHSDEALLEIKERKRQDLIRWLAERQGLGEKWAKEMIDGKNPIGIWTRRLVEYKRADRLAEIANDPVMAEAFLKTGIVFVLGGRIHQDDGFGPHVYDRLQEAFLKNPKLKERIIFLDNYNIFDAPALFHGANFSVMLANDGREASATGFQKAQMNGGLIIASDDGAVPESVNFFREFKPLNGANGFEVPYYEFPNQKEKRQPTAAGLLSAFVQFREVYDDQATYGKMVRNALKSTPFVSVRRTAQDQLKLIEKMFEVWEHEKDVENSGRSLVESLYSGSDMSPAAARAVLEILDKDPKRRDSFTWKFKAHMKDDVAVFNGGPGLEGFVSGYKYISELGSTAEWILDYHGFNSQGHSDIANHLLYLLADIPQFEGLVAIVKQIALEAENAKNPFKRRQLNRKLLGIADGILIHLNALAQQDTAAPGTMGFWHGTDKPFWEKGLVEGALALIVSLFVMSIFYSLAPVEVNAYYRYFTLVVFGIAAVIGFNMVGHNFSGVDLGLKTGPSQEPRTIKQAIGTANISAWGVPFLAAVFFAPPLTAAALFVIGLLLGAGLHAIRNLPFDWRDAPLTLQERQLADELTSGRMKSLSDIGFIQSENLNDYNPERRAVADYSRANEPGSAASLFMRHAAYRGTRSFKTGELATLLKPGAHRFLIPKGEDQEFLMAQIAEAETVAAGEKRPVVSVYLSPKNAHLLIPLSDRFHDVLFLTDGELKNEAEIEDMLLRPIAENGGDLEVLMNGSADMPAFILNTIVEIAHARYPDRVRFIIAEALNAQAAAIRIDALEDMRAMLKFVQLVGSQA